MHPKSAEYLIWPSRPVADPRGATEAQLRAAFVEIVGVEGPVLAQRVFQAYSRAGGVARVTAAFRPKLTRALKSLIDDGSLIAADEYGEGDENPMMLVLRTPAQPAVRLRTLGDRSFNDIPPSEIAERMLEIRAERDLIGKEELTREVLDAYGLKRLTSLVARHVDLVIEKYF